MYEYMPAACRVDIYTFHDLKAYMFILHLCQFHLVIWVTVFNEYMGTTWYSLRFTWSTTSHGYMFTKFEVYEVFPWICTSLFGCMDAIWISLAVPSVLAVQAPASGTGLNSFSTLSAWIAVRNGPTRRCGPPPTKERWNSLSRWNRYMCTNVHGKRPWTRPRHRLWVWSTCLWQWLSRSTMPSRSTMAPCRLSNILTTTQDLHPGTAAFTMRWPTCCGASRQQSRHTRPSSTWWCLFPMYARFSPIWPWLGQSFQQTLSQPDVPGWTCVHVRYYGAWIAECSGSVPTGCKFSSATTLPMGTPNVLSRYSGTKSASATRMYQYHVSTALH